MSQGDVQGTESQFACPACGYQMWDDPLGSFEFRGVCGWQDDACQRIFPFSAIGANHQSLFDYQEEVRQREADGHIKVGQYERDPNWRWFTEDDQARFTHGAPTTGEDYFFAGRDADVRAAESGDYTIFEYWRRAV
jgi:hypothetical protein